MKKFDRTIGSRIDLGLAARWTANYRRDNPGQNEIKAHMFGREILKRIQSQKDCVGIRMYYALNEAGVKQLILGGVDSYGQDMEEGIVADLSSPCPPDCSVGSQLSSGSVARKTK